jgi:hypothetical protein
MHFLIILLHGIFRFGSISHFIIKGLIFSSTKIDIFCVTSSQNELFLLVPKLTNLKTLLLNGRIVLGLLFTSI